MCFNSQSLLVYRVLFTELGVVSQIRLWPVWCVRTAMCSDLWRNAVIVCEAAKAAEVADAVQNIETQGTQTF